MKRAIVCGSAGMLAGFLLGIAVWQAWVVGPWRQERESWRAHSLEIETLRQEIARLASTQVDEAELKRLREGEREVLRLRSQVSQLRQEVQNAKAAVPVTRFSAAEIQSPSTPTEAPVETYSAKVAATVGWKQSLVTGGWSLPSGKRAFVFVEPSPEGGENAVLLRSRIAEIPESLLRDFGLEGFRAENETGSGGGRGLLTVEQSQQLIKRLEGAEGVTLLGAPQVMTLSGRQAQVAVQEAHTLPSGETILTGPVIDVMPTLAADGQSVHLVVGAQLNLPKAKSP